MVAAGATHAASKMAGVIANAHMRGLHLAPLLAAPQSAEATSPQPLPNKGRRHSLGGLDPLDSRSERPDSSPQQWPFASGELSTGTFGSASSGRRGRFYPDEKLCFKRVPAPSEAVADIVYGGGIGCPGGRLVDWSTGWGRRPRPSSEGALHRPDSGGGVKRSASSCGGSNAGNDRSPRRMSSRSASPRNLFRDDGELTSPGKQKTILQGGGDLEGPLGGRSAQTPVNSLLSAPKLPDEEKTAMVLEVIFPRSPNVNVLNRVRSTTITLNESGLLEHEYSCGADEAMRRNLLASPVKRPKEVQPQQHVHLAPGLERQGSNEGLDSKNGDRTLSPGHVQAKRQVQNKLMGFRIKMLEQFQTVSRAFDTFAMEKGYKQELTRRQFSRFLSSNFPGLSKEEHVLLFNFLDADKSGTISMHEFHTCVEASAPVRSIEDLRWKWVALGYNCMRHALQAMARATGTKDDLNALDRRYTQAELGAALSRVGVETDAEHQAVYNAIRDPHDQRNSVSLEQLTSAITVVSPALLLEEMRSVYVKKFPDFDACFLSYSPSGEEIRYQHFQRAIADSMRMSLHEARKAFDLIDCDGNGSISRSEFITAFRLSEPSFNHETLRRKVRQRFRSIDEAFKASLNDDMEGFRKRHSVPGVETAGPSGNREKGTNVEAFRNASITVDAATNAGIELSSILRMVHLTEEDSQMLFELVDCDGNGRVTPQEFQRGVRMFAPACVLEDLRLFCIRTHGSVVDAFRNVPQERREAVLDFKGFEQLMDFIGVPPDSLQLLEIFSLIENRKNGGLTVGEVVSGLKSTCPGEQVPLTPEQRQARARSQIKWQLAPFSKCARDLKSEIRVGQNEERLAILEAKAAEKHDAELMMQTEVSGKPERRLRKPISHGFTNASFSRFQGYTDETVEEVVCDKVYSYYVSVGVKLAHDTKLIRPLKQSRSDQHLMLNKHRQYLARDAPLMVAS